MIRAIASLALVLLASPAVADFVIEEGSFFVYQNDYDHKTDSFTGRPPEGQENGCFQITKVSLERKTIDFTLVTGTITPWWADGETFEPGFNNAFVPAIGFTENRPDAEWTDLLKTMLKTLPSCPAPQG